MRSACSRRIRILGFLGFVHLWESISWPKIPSRKPKPSVATAGNEEGKEEAVKLHQKVEIAEAGPCKKHVKVTIERADIDRILDKKFTELVADAPVDGFRPGKAPRKLIEKRYQKEVRQRVRGELLLQSLEQMVEETELAPLSPPQIEPDSIFVPDEGPLVYEFDVEVRPEFELPSYKGLKVKRSVRKFVDADVDEAYCAACSRHTAAWCPSLKAGPKRANTSSRI